MSKDFNDEMFSAILASNEKTMSLLTNQLEHAQKQAKWNEIKFYVTVAVFAVMFGALLWVYHNKKTDIDVKYLQDNTEAIVTDNSSITSGDVN